jgi:hypothetical protein
MMDYFSLKIKEDSLAVTHEEMKKEEEERMVLN